MKKILYILIALLIIGGTGAAFAGNYTLVQTQEEFVLLEKESFNYKTVYVDTRNWTVNDYAEHPEILSGLIEKGYSDLKKHLENSEIKQKLNEIGENFKSLMDSIEDLNQ